MQKKLIPIGEQRRLIDFYSGIGKPYEFHRAGNSQLLFIDNMCYYSMVMCDDRKHKEGVPTDQLYFINKVKRYIERNELTKKIKPNYKDRATIKFFDYNKRIDVGEVFTDVYSVDIEKAYWRSAYTGGWLGDELYNDGLLIHKTPRLASLGSFAKNIDVYSFDGFKERFVRTIAPVHPHVFFNQANSIYKAMDACRKQLRSISGSFFFYWTDGLYVSGAVAAGICESVIDSHGFGFKTQKLDKVFRGKMGFKVFEGLDCGGTEMKIYPIPHNYDVSGSNLKNNEKWIEQKPEPKKSPRVQKSRKSTIKG